MVVAVLFLSAVIEAVIEALGEEVVVEGERKKDLEVAVLGNLALGVGEIGRRKRRMNGDQGVEMIAGGIMKDQQGGPHHLEEVLHLLGVMDHLEVKEEELGGGEMLRQEDLHQEEARLLDVDLLLGVVLHQEGDHHLEGTLETKMEVVHGGLVLEMIHQEVDEVEMTVVLLGVEEGTLVREEVLLQEEALHLGETLAVMRIVEEVLLIVTVVEPGAAEATGLLVEEALLRDVGPHQEEGLHH